MKHNLAKIFAAVALAIALAVAAAPAQAQFSGAYQAEYDQLVATCPADPGPQPVFTTMQPPSRWPSRWDGGGLPEEVEQNRVIIAEWEAYWDAGNAAVAQLNAWKAARDRWVACAAAADASVRDHMARDRAAAKKEAARARREAEERRAEARHVAALQAYARWANSRAHTRANGRGGKYRAGKFEGWFECEGGANGWNLDANSNLEFPCRVARSSFSRLRGQLGNIYVGKRITVPWRPRDYTERCVVRRPVESVTVQYIDHAYRKVIDYEWTVTCRDSHRVTSVFQNSRAGSVIA